MNPTLLNMDLTDHPINSRSYREPIRVIKQPRRNEKCPCGSGKKYKNCCIGKYASDIE